MSLSSQFPKWDAHHHLWTYSDASMDWIPEDSIRRDFLLPEWIQQLDEAGVNQSILVQVHQTWEETEWMMSLASQTDRIAGVVGWVDLFSPTLSDDLKQLASGHPVVGFRHIMQAEPADWWQRKELSKGINLLGQNGFSYDVLLTQTQLPLALDLLPRCEQTRLIIDHMAKPLIGQVDRSAWEKPMKTLARLPHVAVKISGFTTEAPGFQWVADDFIPYFDFLLEHFGPNRLMLGSDWPVCLMAASYQQQWDVVENWMSAFSQDEKKALWYQSAQTWYGF